MVEPGAVKTPIWAKGRQETDRLERALLAGGALVGTLTQWVQVLADILLPSAILFLVLLCNDTAILGPWVNKTWQNVVDFTIIGVLIVLSLIMVVSTLFASVNGVLLTEALFAAAGGAVLVIGAPLLLLLLRSRKRRIAAGGAPTAGRRPGPRPPHLAHAAAGPAAQAGDVTAPQGQTAHPARLPHRLGAADHGQGLQLLHPLTHAGRGGATERKAVISGFLASAPAVGAGYFAARAAAGLVVGAAIGLERQWRQRTAGLRTNALVALGAALEAAVSRLSLEPGVSSVSWNTREPAALVTAEG